MTKLELIEKSKEVFEQYNKEETLYCIDDGNFWLSKNKGSASMYSKRMGKELITINKSDIYIEEAVIVEDKKPKKTSRKRTKQTNKK